MAHSDWLDCQRCGACCQNTPQNRQEGFVDYIQVEFGASILRRHDLLRRFVVNNAEGVPHLRLDPQGRCLALRGAIGRNVGCAIYHHRPRPCRQVQAGGALCLKYRRAAGIE